MLWKYIDTLVFLIGKILQFWEWIIKLILNEDDCDCVCLDSGCFTHVYIFDMPMDFQATLDF